MRMHVCPNCGSTDLVVRHQEVPEGTSEDPLTTQPSHDLTRIECHNCGWSGTVAQRAIH